MRCALLSIVVLVASTVSAGEGVDLAKLDGWDLVVADDAPLSTKYAAEELQRLYERGSGVKLPIVSAAKGSDGHVVVGNGVELPQSHRRPAGSEPFGPEDLRIVVADGAISVTGGEPRGVLYGVYTFAEDCLGVRFLTADHTHVPPVGESRIVGPVDSTYRPPLEFRHTYYGEVNRNPAFAVRLRNNAVHGIKEQWGGPCEMHLINHTFSGQIPTRVYGDEHPEYFALIEGKRRNRVRDNHDWSWYGTQPCLTNPDVLRIVTESVLATLDKHPAWKNISVSQNDNRFHCRCPKCREIDEPEGSPMGSLLTFVNRVADAVAKEHPGVMVGTLAYQYSRKPPKTIRPRDNVQIQLCSIECCQFHPIADPDCPKNVAFCNDMTAWGEICDNIYIWNYNTNFREYLLPCANLRVIQPNVRYFVANNARGTFMQAAGNAVGAELSELRAYVISNLIWDPSRSADELTEEFLTLHYGPAAPPIREFIDYTHDRSAASGKHPRCNGSAGDFGVDEAMARKGLECFAAAMRLAGEDETLRNRLEKASICAHRAAIEPVWRMTDPGKLDADLAAGMRPKVRTFLRLCETHGVNMVSEGTTFADKREQLRGLFGVGEGEEF